jgi:hypothetical protein
MERSTHYDAGCSEQTPPAEVSTSVFPPDVSKITTELAAVPSAQAQAAPETPWVSPPTAEQAVCAGAVGGHSHSGCQTLQVSVGRLKWSAAAYSCG